MAASWNWFIRNAALMLLAVALAAALGATELFRTTSVIGRHLTASDLVRFAGYGAALVLLWLTARNATVVLRERGGRWTALAHVLLPGATLVVVAAAHAVLLLVLDPLMGSAWHQAYNWIFIAAIVASAGWLVLALFDEQVLRSLLSGASVPKRRAWRCPSCGAPLSRSARHCNRCGTAVADSGDTDDRSS